MEELKRKVDLLTARVNSFDADVIRAMMSQAIQEVSNPHRKASDRAWDLVTKIGAGVAIVAVTGVFTLFGRVQHIESTRMDQREIMAMFSELDKRIIEAARGPDWLRAEIAGIGARMDAVRDNLGKLAERVARMENK